MLKLLGIYYRKFLMKLRKVIMFSKRIRMSESAVIGIGCSIGKNVTIGKNCYIGDYVGIYDKVNIFHNVDVDKYTSINSYTLIDSGSIGKFCSIGPFCHIGAGNHAVEYMSTSQHAIYGKNNIFGVEEYWESWQAPPQIGHDVWIGSHVIIMQHVNIGHGSIIGAGSVVTKDIPPYAIAVGTPAKVIRYRFSEEKIAYLLSLKWWDLPLDELVKYKSVFCSKENWFNEKNIKH